MQPDDPSCRLQIEQAIHALSDVEWYRLRRAGQVLALKVPVFDGEALLLEALERSLSGRRRWNPEAVDFVGHLIGVMRSLASHAAARTGATVPLTSSVELIGTSDPEAAMSAEEQIRLLRAYFTERQDSETLQVLDAMELGCDSSMIRMQWSISQTKLDTIVRRIRRVAEQILPR